MTHRTQVISRTTSASIARDQLPSLTGSSWVRFNAQSTDHVTIFVMLALVIAALNLAVHSSAYAAEAAAQRDITFDTVKFPMEKTDTFRREMLTPEIEKLVGKRVRIRGYMLPSFQQEGITQFVLVRDNMECCFGPGAALYDCMLVQMKEGKSASFSTRPIAVEGVFNVRELPGPDGKLLAIYHLDGEDVR
jgi:hypothetical protein